jgi:hypothetical protein
MDALKELVKIVNRKRLSKIDVFDKTFLSQNNSNLYYKLYEGLESGKVNDDVSAAKYLYDTEEKDARFRKLKSRFKSKLQKTLLMLDTEDVFVNNQSRAYYECVLSNQIIEIIIKITGTTKLVYELVKENYAKALQYNFYDILRNYSFYLLSYYAIKGDSKSFSKEQENYLKFIELAQKEQFAKFLYFKSTICFENQAPITDSLLEDVNNSLIQMLTIRNTLHNIEIDFYYFYLALEFYQKSNQLGKLLGICNEAEELMRINPSAFTNTRKIIIMLFKLSALLSTKQFKEGVDLIKNESAINIPESNYNWYLLKDIEFKLYLQNNNISDAYSVYNEVLENKSFKRQDSKLTERWKIYHAYLVFYDSFLNKGDYKFSLPKFLNDVPVNSKDKSGYNFAIRVIEILFNAARKDYNLIFSKMDALRVYRTRYLNDNTYKRNHLFLSILLKAEKSGFSNKEMASANWPEIAELRKQNNYIIADWEIIPYETLWDIFVELAKK